MSIVDARSTSLAPRGSLTSPADLSKILDLHVLFTELRWDPVIRDVCVLWRDFYDTNRPASQWNSNIEFEFAETLQTVIRMRAQGPFYPFAIVRGCAVFGVPVEPPKPQSKWKTTLNGEDRKRLANAQKQERRRKR